MSEAPPQPFDPPLRFCETRSLRLTYTEEGDAAAPPIVLVHGIPGGATDFRYLAPLLAARLRVLRFEMPGYGSNRAAALPGPEPAARARAVLEFTDALALDRFALVGHSMGGRTALEVAGQRPDRVAALGLLASVGLRRHRGMAPPVFGSIVRVGGLAPLRPRLVTLAQAAYRKARFPNAERYTYEDFLLHAQMVTAIDFAGARAAARAVRCPALVAAADDDHLIERAIAEELSAALRARLMTFETGGHNIQKTQARALATALCELAQAALR
ncbi:MAG: alpha/beta hydrolase [Nannocystaceae bacterium]